MSFAISLLLHLAPPARATLPPELVPRTVDTRVIEPDTGVFSPDGRRFFLASSHGDRTIVDLSDMHFRPLIDHEQSILRTAVGRARENVLGVVLAATVDKRRRRKTVRGNDRTEYAAFSPDGTELLVLTQRHEAELWDVETGRLVSRVDDGGPGRRKDLEVRVEGAAYTARGPWRLARETPRLGREGWLAPEKTSFVITDVRTGREVVRLGHRALVDRMIAAGWRGELNVQQSNFAHFMAVTADGSQLLLEAIYQPDYRTAPSRFEIAIDLHTHALELKSAAEARLPLSTQTQPREALKSANAEAGEVIRRKGLLRRIEEPTASIIYEAPHGRSYLVVTDEGLVTEHRVSSSDPSCPTALLASPISRERY